MHVVSVERTDVDAAIWTFDTEIISSDAGLIFGVEINGGDPEDFVSESTFAIELTFPDDVHVGDPWRVTNAFTGITFAGGISPLPQTGTVIA